MRRCRYAVLLGASQSVEEYCRDSSVVSSVVVPACETDASGAVVPNLSAIDTSSPAQRAAWMASFCAATPAMHLMQRLPAGLVLPAISLRYVCNF
jgi:hypothetical protein